MRDLGAPEGFSQHFTLDNDVDELGTHGIWVPCQQNLSQPCRQGEKSHARTESYRIANELSVDQGD